MFNAEAQPVVRDAVATTSVDARLTFLKRVYGWMTAAIAVAGIGAYASVQLGWAQSLLNSGWVGWIVGTLVWWGLAFAAKAVRHKPGVNIAAYGLFAFFTGFYFSATILIAMLYAQALGHGSGYFIYQAFGITFGIFAGLTIFTMTTKKDFSFMRGMLTAGSVGLLIAIVLYAIIGGSIFGLVISLFGVLLFSGYILYDTQRILKSYPSREYLAASLELFLDFALLFIYVLNTLLRIAALTSGD